MEVFKHEHRESKGKWSYLMTSSFPSSLKVLAWWCFKQCSPAGSFLSRDLCSPCSCRRCWSCAQHTHSFYCFYSMFSYRENWCKMALAQVGIESWDSHLLLAQQRVRFPDISFLWRESNKTRQEGIITSREYWNGCSTGSRNSTIITHEILQVKVWVVSLGGNNSWFPSGRCSRAWSPLWKTSSWWIWFPCDSPAVTPECPQRCLVGGWLVMAWSWQEAEIETNNPSSVGELLLPDKVRLNGLKREVKKPSLCWFGFHLILT